MLSTRYIMSYPFPTSICLDTIARIFKRVCSLAGRYDYPLPPRFLAPIDSSKNSSSVFWFVLIIVTVLIPMASQK
jgi:hypothetical protein